MTAIHNFDFGDEFEVAICKTFRRILPQKFGICRGFVVNSRGDTAGDDIIIFDRMRFPTIRSLDAEDYARKEQVPIEAVYAYIEAKHSLSIQGDDKSSLARAIQQVSRVKLLCVQRWRVPLSQILPNVEITNEASIEPCPDWPDIRNPVFGLIIARQMRLRKREAILNDADTIEKALLDSTHMCALPPDMIIAGANNLLIPALPSNQPNASRSPSPFFLYGRSHMNPVTVDGIAFGAGLSFLLWALDWIQLGEMPWAGILRNAMPPKCAKLK